MPAPLRLPALLAAAGIAAAAEPALPPLHPLFGDDMVFPRDRPAPVWGWSTPGARITVSLAGATAAAVAGPDGRWQATLGPLPAGGPWELEVAGPQPVVRHRVMIGDVWLFAGQSNMAFPLRQAVGGPEEAAGAAAATGVRVFNQRDRVAGRPAAVPPGAVTAWKPAGPEVAALSAVAWFTGRRLQAELKVPIGVVASALGGSNIRAWLPEESLARLGLYADERAELARLISEADAAGCDAPRQERIQIEAWWRDHDPGTRDRWYARDAGEAGAAWSDQAVPGTWSDDGVSWLRCDVELPEAAAGRPGTLRLGAIHEDDRAWVGGVEVGGSRWDNTRAYPIPAGVLVAGRNRIALRCWATSGHGRAFAGNWRLEWDGGRVDLPATWRRAVSAGAQPVRPWPRFQGGNGSPTMIWNGAIRPLVPFAFAGVVWYQGEQDAGSPDYRRLLPELIGSWRGAFADPQLPFVLVGLPAFHAAVAEPVQQRLTFGQVRDDQLAAVRALPRVGLAVTTDLGDAAEVHPTRKREVGERAAAAALALAYGRDGGGGPIFHAAEPAGAAMRVTFERVSGGGLELRPLQPGGFAVAGADGRWHHAIATLAGDAVLVASPEVPAPVAVRYDWADNPPVSLYDRAGFPAAPFRSDDR